MKDKLFLELNLAYNIDILSSSSYIHIHTCLILLILKLSINNLTILVSDCQLSILLQTLEAI